MTIKSKTIHIVREVIEEKRAHLLSLKDTWNWENIKEFWNRYYEPNFCASAEDVYQRMKVAGLTTLHLVKLKCELCERYFDLDKPFVELIMDRGGWDDVSITFHPECMGAVFQARLGGLSAFKRSIK